MKQDDDTSRLEAEAQAVFYDFTAQVLLDPIPVPGKKYASDLLEHTYTLVAHIDDNVPGSKDLRSWCASFDDAATQQRALAIDRTRLCRGTSQEGPLPPYEEYWAAPVEAGSGVLPAVERCYAQADAQIQNTVERSDYLGIELAFLSYMCHCELDAIAAGNATAANRARRQRETFEREHLLAWLPAYSLAAAAQAQTPFFRGLFAFLAAYAQSV